MAGALLLLTGCATGGSGSGGTAQVNRDFLTGFGYIPGSAQTNYSVTCSASGGIPPYTYLWDTGDVTTIFPTTPTSATTYFAMESEVSNQETATFTCTVTDSAAATWSTPAVTVTLNLRDPSEPIEVSP